MREVPASEGANGRPLNAGVSPCALPNEILRQLRASLKKQWKRYRKALRRCQKAFSEKGVHESRVETRRLLSVAELLRSFLAVRRLEKIQSCVKRHLDTFDELRDTQVQLLAIKGLRSRFPAAEDYYEHLVKQEKRLTARTGKSIKRIRAKRLERLIDASRADVRPFLNKVPHGRQNSKLVRTLRSAFEHTRLLKESIDPTNIRTIHCTRVAFKRFRYMVEVLADLLPLASQEQLLAMHDYQTLMGEVQDAEVLLQSFSRYTRKQAIAPMEAPAFHDELWRRRQDRVQAYMKNADDLLDFWPSDASRKELTDCSSNGSPEGSRPSSPSAQTRRRRRAES